MANEQVNARGKLWENSNYSIFNIPMFITTAINFNDYFWTPYSLAILLVIAFFEGFLATKFLTNGSFKKQFVWITLTYVAANIFSFFSEYYLSIFLNGGHRILVWIPWVRLIGSSDLYIYIASFLIIFLFTFISEFLIAATLLRKRYKLAQVLKTTFKMNLISTVVLVVMFNGIAFNFIKGQEEGFFEDTLEILEPNQK